MSGTFWSVDLAWLLGAIVLAGIVGAILAVEVDSGFRLAKAVCAYVIARTRRCLTEWRLRR